MRIPFRNLSTSAWQNIALAAMALFYAIQVGLDLAWGNTFGNLGIDFASFWSAGRIANQYGYGRIYDLGLMQQVQQQLLPKTANLGFVFHPIPTPYLAVFMPPFQALALLPPVAAFWLWTVVNLIALVLYLRFFVRHTTNQKARTRLLAFALLAVPTFLTLFDGQVNVWLAICVGEYLRAALEGRELRAGLWLGGLLLKPQCLIILVPALLIQRSGRTLIGLAISSAVAIGVSALLGGITGLRELMRLWLGYAGGLPTNDIQLMMNWRMLGLLAAHISSGATGFALAVCGSIATLAASLYLWRRRLPAGSTQQAVAILGSLAATGAVAWHSHAHMAMILLPPLLYLHLKEPELFRGKLELWVLAAAGAYALRLLLASAVYAGALPGAAIGWIDPLTGLALFALSLYFLGWAVGRSRAPQIRDAALEALKLGN